MSVKGADDLETLLEAVGLKLSPLQMEPLQKTEAEFTAEMRLLFLDVRSMQKRMSEFQNLRPCLRIFDYSIFVLIF